MSNVTILGIESSCDDTSCAVIRGGVLLSNVIASQAVHEAYGGVVPELASRAHQQNIVPVVSEAIRRAGIHRSELTAVAFTRGPGLLGSLLVGTSFAKGLAISLGIPMIEVNHLQAHVLAHFIKQSPDDNAHPAFPFICLLVSGGNSQIIRVEAYDRMEVIGQTIDDAAGEAFDKSAKLLELGYPGGPALSALAAQADPTRPDAPRFTLPRPKLKSDDLDFSFSGLKTAVLTQVKKGLAPEHRPDLAREVEEAITDVLVGKALKALKQTGLSRLVISGGVSANRRLRAKLAEASARWPAKKAPLRVHFPPLALCTDNGAMIAYAGACRLAATKAAGPEAAPLAGIDTQPLRFDVRPRWPLEELPAVSARPPAAAGI